MEAIEKLELKIINERNNVQIKKLNNFTESELIDFDKSFSDNKVAFLENPKEYNKIKQKIKTQIQFLQNKGGCE